MTASTIEAQFDESFVSLLEEEHRTQRVIPRREATRAFAATLLGILFPPLRLGVDEGCSREIAGVPRSDLKELAAELLDLLTPLTPKSADLTQRFCTLMPRLRQMLMEDAEAMYEGDPAARSVDEVIMAYPGFLALGLYRIGHFFYSHELPVFARVITEYAHQLTGIDIHPGAVIGRRFCIDHGTGIVIGETTVIEDNVKIYQGVTLGALSVAKEFANKRRHPTIERNTVLYANATVLGGETVVGHDSVIGGSAWVTSSVAPHSTVYHKSEVRVQRSDDAARV